MNPKYICPKCGTLVFEQAKHCHQCGARLKRYHKNKTKIIFAIVMILAVAFAGKVLYGIRKNNRLEKLADEPYIEIDFPDYSYEEILALDPDAFWNDEKNMESISNGLSDHDKKALNHIVDSLKYGSSYSSKQEMISALKYKDVSAVRAEKMIDLCQVDFKMQALKKTLYLMNNHGFSPASLKKQLLSLEFTPEEADYALENCGADWDLQTKFSVQSRLNYLEISEQGLYELMESEGYDVEIVKKYVDEIHPDWNIECLQAALFYRSIYPTDLDKYLTSEKFTPEQIEYVMELIE